MALPLTPDILRAVYDALNVMPPFRGWNLPDGEDVAFKVARHPALRGWYDCPKGKHTIAISSRVIGRTESLVATMAHEMIHLHEAHTGAKGCGQHSRAFQKWAVQVCRIHGFDEKLF